MTVNLVAEASDRFFPHAYPIEFEKPYDLIARSELKEGIHDMLDYASVHEYKIIEENDRYDILFRLPHDVYHFDFMMNENLENPVLTSFATPYKNKPYIQDTYKLKRKFAQAIEKSQVSGHVKASVKPESLEVFVRAETGVHYFDFWKSVPYPQRIKMAMIPE